MTCFEQSIVGLWQADYAETLQRVADLGGADLIFTSPPYADARTYGNAVDWKFEDYQRLGDFIKPALKPGGHCLLNLDAPVREWRPGYGTERGFHPWKVMIDWAERVGMRVPDRLAYGRMGMPGRYEGRFRNDWEPMLWFQRGCESGWFDKAPISDAAKYPERGGLAGSRNSKGVVSKRIRSGDAVDNGLVRRGTFWDYGAGGNLLNDDALSSVQHPARFCLRLASDVVRCFCPPGGMVVDPFLGSGTTMIAALDHGRRFAGGDLFARTTDGMPWVEVAREVARKRFAQQSLFGGG
jgi:DNA modification methylase